MNKMARVKVEVAQENSVAESLQDLTIQESRSTFAKQRVEAEIRTQLAEFAAELSNARKLRKK